MPFKSEKQRRWMHANNPKMAAKWETKEKKMKREQKVRELIKKMVREELAGLDEAAKRDYKAEYKKFQSSDKSKKYRAELNKYNRQKGTYGNGDGKDASHKGGKIVGFEKESVNRGRAEKSRLKKEGKVTEAHDGKWVVHTASDAYSKPKIMKVAKSKRAATILYNKLIKTDKYEAIGMESVEHWNRTNSPKIKEGKLTEAKETIFDVAAKVMKDSQMYNYKSKKGMVKVDMQTANLLTQVFKKINPKMKKILSDLGEKNPAQLVQTLQAVIK